MGCACLSGFYFWENYTTRYLYTGHSYQSSTIHNTQGLLADARGLHSVGYVACLCGSVRTRVFVGVLKCGK